MFLPTTKNEARELGWNKLDVILVTGDSYIDSPYIGVAVIGKLLTSRGYRVGVIAQPDVNSPDDITRLGEPELFWGVSGGSVDSMVANYTASKKRRKQDDYTPGGVNDRRPDRAVIVYTNLIRRYYKNTKSIILGGIEASLRRVTQYDYWDDKLRRPILFDAKADYLLYGMAEKAIIELADKLKNRQPVNGVRGLCYISRDRKEDFVELPSYEACTRDRDTFTDMFRLFYDNNDPLTAKGLCQKTGDRYLVQNPPQPNPSERELDSYYELDYERDVHPGHKKAGKVRALDTIRFSITTHRGCYGECNFCAIAVHQGRTVISRSPRSILKEAEGFTKNKKFKGIIADVGGPTANMYGFECAKKLKSGVCTDKRCVYPQTCQTLKPNHLPLIELMKALRKIQGVNKVFVASGLRHDLVLDDERHGKEYLRQAACYHTSGQMKIAPEHTDDRVLALMGKSGTASLLEFKELFGRYSKQTGKRQFLTYYFIAAHPGCTDREMLELKQYASEKLSVSPEQVQIFTPAPSTWSSLMYYTEKNPFTGEKLFVEKSLSGRERQKRILTEKGGRPALKAPGRKSRPTSHRQHKAPRGKGKKFRR
ncbi:YgiQ family radical SAM protein [candidate division KSB1 bacterium]|nr:YgiQ family radical SAM protein [candidate division KSB1 bacterium]